MSDDIERRPSADSGDIQAALERIRAALDSGEPDVDQAFALVKEVVVRSGPLPVPEELAAFDAVLPGLAETIVAMWQNEQAHQIYLDTAEQNREDRLVEIEAKQTDRGMWMSFILAVLFLLIAALALFLGYRAASLIGIVPSMVLFAAFGARLWNSFTRR